VSSREELVKQQARDLVKRKDWAALDRLVRREQLEREAKSVRSDRSG
jgi:hypothetical protein